MLLPFGAGKSAELAIGCEPPDPFSPAPELPHAASSSDRATRPRGTAMRRLVMARRVGKAEAPMSRYDVSVNRASRAAAARRRRAGIVPPVTQGRAALVTGGSSGIGLAIARALGSDGYALTVSARRPDKLEAAVSGLRDEGVEAQAVPANMASEEDIKRVVDAHREHHGRLDVLINNAGVGIGSPIADAETKKLDMQFDVNLRGVYLTLRECIPMLKEAGAEHGKALVVNTASIAGVRGQGWLAAYSATKAAVIGLSQAAHMELSNDGIQVTAFAPGFVDTPMTDWAAGEVAREDMIRPEDLAEAVRFLLRTSPACIVPEMRFIRPGE